MMSLFKKPVSHSFLIALPLSVLLAACDGSTPVEEAPGPTPSDDPSVVPTTEAEETPEIKLALTPIVRLEADRTAFTGELIGLSATVRLSGLPVSVPTVLWEVLSGPGTVVFSSASEQNPQVTFDIPGRYVLKMAAFNGSESGFDTMLVTVVSAAINEAPQVDAGNNRTVDIDETLELEAVVTDDGLTDSAVEISWREVSGPGTATFAQPDNAITAVAFSSAGTYILEIAANDGELTATDRVQVKVENAIVSSTDVSTNEVSASENWSVVNTSNGSEPKARHEAGGVAYKNEFYLLGGRGKRPVDRYNPSNNRWENLGTPSQEMHHFQPVVYNGKIYVIGALACCFPSESVINRIQIFDPKTRKWSEGAKLPSNRLRGSAGVVVYNNKIYIVGGTTNGHDGGTVNWFDEYNPSNNSWKTLPNAPTKRDHFSAAIVGNKLVAAGGRQTDYPDTFSNLVSRVDVYNFQSGKWEAGHASIPTQRAGAVVASQGDEVLVIGGETAKAGPALKTVEAYNVNTKRWRTLKSLRFARHSGGIAHLSNSIHVASGNGKRGGGNEITSHEKLDLD